MKPLCLCIGQAQISAYRPELALPGQSTSLRTDVSSFFALLQSISVQSGFVLTINIPAAQREPDKIVLLRYARRCAVSHRLMRPTIAANESL